MLRFRRQALAVVGLVTVWPAVVLGQTVKAGIVTTLEGHVTATRAVHPQPVPLKFKDAVFLQDTIRTGDRSLARLLLGGKAMVTVREHSMLTITELPGRSVITLESGKVGLAVALEKMRPGEVIHIRTPNAIVGVRGTVVVVEVFRATAQAGEAPTAVTTNAYVLKGIADATPANPATGAPTGVPVTLSRLQQFRVTGTLGRVHPMSLGQVGPVTAGLESRGHPHTEAGNKEEVKTRIIQATAAVLDAVTDGLNGQAGAAAGEDLLPGEIADLAQGGAKSCTPSGSPFCKTALLPPNTPSATILPFPELEIEDEFITQAVGILASGGRFSRSETSAPFDVRSGSTIDHPGVTTPFIHVDGANTIADLAGALAKIDNSTIISSGPVFVLSNGASLSSSVGRDPNAGFIEIDDSTIGGLAGLVRVFAGSQLVVGSSNENPNPDPVVLFSNTPANLGASPDRGIFEFFGRPSTTADEIALGVPLTLGTDEPIQTARTLLEATAGSTITAERGAVFDHALFNATAPIFEARRNSSITMAGHAIDLTSHAKLISDGAVVKLEASVLTILNGSVINVAGGSLMRVTGDVFSLKDASTLRALNGALITVSGGSVFIATGALAVFNGAGGNAISVAGGACGGPCDILRGIPVLVTGGATLAQITIGPNPLKNPGLGTLTSSGVIVPPGAIVPVPGATSPAIVVNGPASRVNIAAP